MTSEKFELSGKNPVSLHPLKMMKFVPNKLKRFFKSLYENKAKIGCRDWVRDLRALT